MTDYVKPEYTGTLVVEGTVKFSNLTKVDDKFRTYGLTLLLDPNDPKLKELREIAKKASQAEKAKVQETKRKTLNEATVGEDDTDKDGNETGMVKLNLKRTEKMGAPEVYDKDLQPINRSFLAMGSKVKVQLLLRSYNVQKTVGLSLKIGMIQVLEEKTKSAKDIFGSSTTETDLDTDETIDIDEVF